MPILVATRTVRIGRTEYKPGDSFEASDKDAKTWIAIRKARLSDPSPPKAVNLPKEVMAKAPVKEVVEDEAPKQKRSYHRRDMTAEEPAIPKEFPTGPTGEGE